jgi:hypothetical protein
MRKSCCDSCSIEHKPAEPVFDCTGPEDKPYAVGFDKKREKLVAITAKTCLRTMCENSARSAEIIPIMLTSPLLVVEQLRLEALFLPLDERPIGTRPPIEAFVRDNYGIAHEISV